MKKPRVLFIINEVAHYTEFKKILVSKLVSESVDCQILFDRDGYDTEVLFSRQIEDCKKNGFKFSNIAKDAFIIPNRLVDKIATRIENSRFLRHVPFVSWVVFLIKNLSSILRGVEFYQKKINYLSKFYCNEKIDTIVIGEENVLMDTFLYKQASEGRKVLVYPYTIPNPLEMKGGAFKCVNASTALAKWIGFWSGRWSRIFGENRCLLLPFHKLISMSLIGYRPSNPWVLNSDTADVVCVESEKMASLYRKFYVPEKRLSVVGTLNDDILANLIKNRERVETNFLKKYNLPLEKPIIVSGFPPNQFPLHTAEHKSYRDLIEGYANSLVPYKEKYNIIISKHPRINDPLEYIKKMEITIVEEPTIELIPIAHIYIGSASATIRWAISAGIPAINYDTYRLGYDDYDNLPAVKTVRSIKDFQEALKDLLTDSAQYNKVKQLQLKDSLLWGNLDGNSGARFVAQLKNN